MNDDYVNIREILGHLIGRTVVDISQHDKEEFLADGRSYVQLIFDNGDDAKFYISDYGFEYTKDSDVLMVVKDEDIE